jgi:hypothetical protein
LIDHWLRSYIKPPSPLSAPPIVLMIPGIGLSGLMPGVGGVAGGRVPGGVAPGVTGAFGVPTHPGVPATVCPAPFGGVKPIVTHHGGV